MKLRENSNVQIRKEYLLPFQPRRAWKLSRVQSVLRSSVSTLQPKRLRVIEALGLC